VAAFLPPITVITSAVGLFTLISIGGCATNARIPVVGLVITAVGSTTLAFRLCRGLAAEVFLLYAGAAGIVWWVIIFIFSGGQLDYATAALLITALFAVPGLLLSMLLGRLAGHAATVMLVGGIALAGFFVTGYSHCNNY
jgi:hypothetical protein